MPKRVFLLGLRDVLKIGYRWKKIRLIENSHFSLNHSHVTDILYLTNILPLTDSLPLRDDLSLTDMLSLTDDLPLINYIYKIYRFACRFSEHIN